MVSCSKNILEFVKCSIDLTVLAPGFPKQGEAGTKLSCGNVTRAQLTTSSFSAIVREHVLYTRQPPGLTNCTACTQTIIVVAYARSGWPTNT